MTLTHSQQSRLSVLVAALLIVAGLAWFIRRQDADAERLGQRVALKMNIEDAEREVREAKTDGEREVAAAKLQSFRRNQEELQSE